MRLQPLQRYHLRGRFHIGYDEEKTLTDLVDDWDRYQRANPDKSSVVLARTRAEVRALSHLMRERRFATLPDGETGRYGTRPMRIRTIQTGVTVMVSRGYGRRAGSLAAGDRARRPVAYRRHALGEAAVQRHSGYGGGLQGSKGRGRYGAECPDIGPHRGWTSRLVPPRRNP